VSGLNPAGVFWLSGVARHMLAKWPLRGSSVSFCSPLPLPPTITVMVACIMVLSKGDIILAGVPHHLVCIIRAL